MSESPADTNARVAAAVDALFDGLDETFYYAVTLDEIERAVERHPGPWPETWVQRLSDVFDALGLAHTTYPEVTLPIPTDVVPCLAFRNGTCVAWIERRGSEICVAEGQADGTYVTTWVAETALLSATQGTLLVVERAPLGHGDPHASEEAHAREASSRVSALARLERSDLWVILLYASAVGVLSLVTPIAVQQLVTTVAFGALLQPFAVLAVAVFALLGAAGALGTVQRWVIEVLEQRLFVRFASAFVARLSKAPLDGGPGGPSGPALASRFLDIAILQKSVATLLTDGLGVVLNAGIGLVVLAFYHPFLLAFDLVLIGGAAVLIWVLGRGAVPTSLSESKKKHDVTATFIALAARGAPLNRAQARREIDRRVHSYVDARRAHFRVLIRQIIGGFALQAIASGLLLGVGGALVVEGQLTLGQLVAAEIIVTMVVASFAKLGKHFEAYYDLVAALDKLGHLVEVPGHGSEKEAA